MNRGSENGLATLYRPMPLVRVPEAFDHPNWTFELHDGFRALAVVDGHRCDLVGHVFTRQDAPGTEISHPIRAHSAVLDGEDGEIVCLDGYGRSTSTSCYSGVTGRTPSPRNRRIR